MKRVKLNRKVARRFKNPFWRGAAQESQLEEEEFYDWLGSLTRGSESRELTKKDFASVFRMSQQGMTNEQMAHALGFGPKKFTTMLRATPELRWAIKAGKSIGIEFVTGKLMSLIKRGNVSAITFYLKVKGGWNEKSILELVPPESVPSISEDLLSALEDTELEQLSELLQKAHTRSKDKSKGALIDGESVRLQDDD